MLLLQRASMFFIPCENQRIVFFIKVQCYPEVLFNRQVLVFFKTSEEVCILIQNNLKYKSVFYFFISRIRVQCQYQSFKMNSCIISQRPDILLKFPNYFQILMLLLHLSLKGNVFKKLKTSLLSLEACSSRLFCFYKQCFFYIKEEVLFESSLVRNHRALTSRHLLVQVFEQISQIVLVFLLLTLNK